MKQRRPTEPGPATVTTRVTGTVIRSGVEGALLDVDLVFEPADPFAASMVFRVGGQEPIRWTFARDLLLHGIDDPAGMGDVQVRPWLDDRARAAVRVGLWSRDGELELSIPRKDVQRFVDAMRDSVAEGAEVTGGDADAELDRLLGFPG